MKVLFTSTHVTSFIREDMEILRRHFHVVPLITKGILAPFHILRLVPRADVTFTWFASTYSSLIVFLARIFDKGSVIVVGGVDAAKLPEINYGIWLSRWKSVLVKYAILHAERVLVVDPSVRQRVLALAESGGHNIECVPTGYDPTMWKRLECRRDIDVLTVAACDDEIRMKAKGLLFLVNAATEMPETGFTIVGVTGACQARLQMIAPRNVTLVPFVPRPDLVGYYSRASVYCQPSYVEGLPNSLCEAMLCECSPVGTAVGGISSAIADAGLLVEYGNTRQMVAALRNALTVPDSVRKHARAHVVEHFALEAREKALLRILQEVSG